MLLESVETPDPPHNRRSTDGPSGLAHGQATNSSIHDDVERLIQIAAQLFGAIERQIHRIEEDLNFSQSERIAPSGHTVFKEQLIRTSSSLHASLNDIAAHLGDGAEHSRRVMSPTQPSYLD